MKSLVTAYFGVWAASFIVHALFMSGVLSQGVFATNPDAQYVCSLISVIITLIFIYLGLKMLAMPKVVATIRKEGFPAYFKYVTIRNSAALIVTLVNILFYNLTLLSSCGLCWLITIFSLFFIKPGQKEFDHITGNTDAAE